MRSLFSSPADTVGGPAAPSRPPATGGWSNLNGNVKLAILSGTAIAIVAAVLWPGSTPPAPQPPADQHPAAPIRDFQPPPAPTMGDTLDGVTSTAPAASAPAPLIRYRPVPTEMSLYRIDSARGSAPPPAATPAAARAAPADGAESDMPPTSHGSLVKHPDFLIRPGTVIPCLPVGHQNSEKPGFEMCNVPVWFRGTNLRRGLLPPHTLLFGHMQAGLQGGEQRLGIVYTLIETPWFNMPLASPAGDPLGAAGLDKTEVQTFFWDRAGAVALYSLMDAGVGIGQSLAASAVSRAFSGNNGTSVNLNTGAQTQSLAGKEFDSTINRPPIGTRAPALPVTVTVGQDLDFYDICMKAMRVDPMACPLQ